MCAEFCGFALTASRSNVDTSLALTFRQLRPITRLPFSWAYVVGDLAWLVLLWTCCCTQIRTGGNNQFRTIQAVKICLDQPFGLMTLPPKNIFRFSGARSRTYTKMKFDRLYVFRCRNNFPQVVNPTIYHLYDAAHLFGLVGKTTVTNLPL